MPPATATSTEPAREHVVREHGGAHARTAHLVDGRAARGERQPRAERGLTGRRLAEAGRQHAAHQRLVDLRGLQSGALERGGDGGGAQLRRGERGEFALKGRHRRAGGGDDHDGIAPSLVGITHV